MAISGDLLYRIMGASDSPTGKLISLRKTPSDGELEPGVWYSNFTRVKTEAERRGIPFFAMWTNGDLCGYCRRFTKNVLDPVFMERMKTSGGLWWLGGSMDENDEDRRGGRGFTWCLGPKNTVSYYPFFAVSFVRDGKQIRSFFGSGHDYDDRREAPDGTRSIMQKLYEIFANRDNPTEYAAVASSFSVDQSSVVPDTPITPVDTTLHIRFNPAWDADHISRFQKALSENGGHCICRKDKTSDTLCMCREFTEKSTPGMCHCGAYEKYRV